MKINNLLADIFLIFQYLDVFQKLGINSYSFFGIQLTKSGFSIQYTLHTQNAAEFHLFGCVQLINFKRAQCYVLLI